MNKRFKRYQKFLAVSLAALSYTEINTQGFSLSYLFHKVKDVFSSKKTMTKKSPSYTNKNIIVSNENLANEDAINDAKMKAQLEELILNTVEILEKKYLGNWKLLSYNTQEALMELLEDYYKVLQRFRYDQEYYDKYAPESLESASFMVVYEDYLKIIDLNKKKSETCKTNFEIFETQMKNYCEKYTLQPNEFLRKFYNKMPGLHALKQCDNRKTGYEEDFDDKLI